MPRSGFAISYALLSLLVFLYIIWSATDPVMAVALVTMLALLPIFFINTKYGLLLLLLLRPTIDVLSFYELTLFDRLTLNLNAIVAVFVCGWAMIVWLREKIVWRELIGVWPLVGVLGVALLSLITSIDLTVSISEWLRLLSIVVIFIMAQHLSRRDPQFIHWLIPTAALSAIIPLAVGLYQLFTQAGLSFGGLDNRIYGTFGHPNVFGFYLVMVLSIVIIKQLTTPKPERSLLYPIIIWLGIGALLFTYTRGSWLGLGIILITLGVMKYRKPLIIAAAIICLLVTFGQVINHVLIDNFNFNLNENALISRFTIRSAEADSIDWRYQVFQTMAPHIREAPWLGVGIGNFVSLRKLGDIGLFEDPEAHNDYLRLAIEIGLPGLILYLFFLGTLAATALRHYAAWPKSAWQKWYSLTLFGLVLAFIVMSIGDNLLQGTPVMWLFMTLAGALLTLRQSTSRS